jgi:NAD(P)-dependent dehydrogenase (short-subunit alcohol dehydrogenase family)
MLIDGVGAVVTGGASGLGEATVRRLVGEGTHVTILDRDQVRGEALADELGGSTRFVHTDVTDPEAVARAVRHAADAAPLRICVNAAGIGRVGRIVDDRNRPHDLKPFEVVVRVNLFGTFLVMSHAAAVMARTEPAESGERGVIVNTASVSAFDGQVGQVAYAASKGGVAAMTLPAARDLAAVGVRVCAIAPGIFDTPLVSHWPAERRAAATAGVPFPKRLGTPPEFAALVQHIAENSYLNGEVMRIDGALRMPPQAE